LSIEQVERLQCALDEIIDAIDIFDSGIPVVGKLTANGNSVCLILPKPILDAAGWRLGDAVYARVQKIMFDKTSIKAEKVPKDD
jgi:hypothetical protein